MSARGKPAGQRPQRENHQAGRVPASPASVIATREHAVLAAALDPIITIDAYGTIQSASDSVQRVFGWAPRELTGQNVHVLMPEPHRSAHDGYLANYRRTGRTNIMGRTRQFEGVRKNGERFPVEISVSRVDAVDGGLPLFVGLIRDVSERVRLERELRLVQELALSISAASDLTGALVETIRQIALATGWDYGELWTADAQRNSLLPAASWSRPGSGLDVMARSMHLCFQRGGGLPGRALASGRPIWVADLSTLCESDFCRPDAARQAGVKAAAAVPILSENQPIGVLLFFVRETRREDVHLLELVRAAVAPLGTLIQRKRAESELDEYRRRLEEKVKERTGALQESQERLRLADRLASIGTLAAGLGHDMNNVLLPVRAHLNALRAEGGQGRLPAPALRHVEAVRKSVAYLQQLADGLHFLAMDPDKAQGDGEVTRLETWWSQAGVLIAKAVPRHVRVQALLLPDLPAVAVATPGLTQAVLNLVVNAGEAIPAGRKRVQGRVRLAAEKNADGTAVRLSVSDNGSGMTDEVRRRAFEMFFTTKPRGLGTGLGLALVRKVAHDAGGSVELASEPGKGTTVTMILPAAAEVHQRAPADATGDGLPGAAVSIEDGRRAALVRHVLEAAGVRATLGDGPAGARIWVVEPTPARLAPARDWLAEAPDRRLVLFGAPRPRHAGAWAELRPVMIGERDDFEVVRAALARALAP